VGIASSLSLLAMTDALNGAPRAAELLAMTGTVSSDGVALWATLTAVTGVSTVKIAGLWTVDMRTGRGAAGVKAARLTETVI
jgi:hypothetical protein